MPLRHFLIVYDVPSQCLLDAKDLGTDVSAAVAAYAEMEDEHREAGNVEIVLIGADSLDTVRLTHSQYFAEDSGDFFSTVVPA